MRYLLVIPRKRDAVVAAAPARRPTTELFSRLDSNMQELDQRWDRLAVPEPDPLASDPDGHRVTVGQIVCSRSRHQQVYLVEVEVTGAQDLEIERLEQKLSTIGRSTVTAAVGPVDLYWVQRVALPAAGQSPAPGWYGPGQTCVVALHGEKDAPAAELEIGWGNVTIRGWDMIGDRRQEQIMEGLVDAQTLWCGLTEISNDSAEDTRRVFRSTELDAKELTRYLAEIEALHIRIAQQHLAYDEFLIESQGNRFSVTEAALESWEYGALMDRVTSRLDLLQTIADRAKSRREERYRRAVESTLLFLTMTTFLTLALTIVQTAHSGGEDAVPGDDSVVGIFRFVRAVDADIGFFIVPTVLLFLSWYVIRRYRR